MAHPRKRSTITSLHDILALESSGPQEFYGRSPQTQMQRTFGGQVAGQALVAATRTVDASLAVHSLHGYFVRAGDPTTGISYRVERVRDGRSFATRTVTARQQDRTIFTMSASFQVAQHGPVHQDDAPVVPGPAELPTATGWESDFFAAEWPDWDLRRIPDSQGTHRPGVVAAQQIWLRHTARLADDPVLHACALAYASDMTLLGSGRLPHQQAALQIASLDHAMWFLRPFRADEWLLYDQSSPSAGGGRCLTQGRIFNVAGELVAAVVQEGLLRDA